MSAVQHSATANIPVTNLFQGRRNISIFGGTENPKAGETRNGQADDKILFGEGGWSKFW
jgi:hypothetical protein